jgi:CMP-N-acetylneuraminic acid synthetase
MKTLITICARGGSKGIPGKNIKLLGDKPLIYYTLKIASVFASLNNNVDVYLSTDSDEIKKTVCQLDLPFVNTGYTRPAKLATDSSGKMKVIHDVLRYAEEENKKEYDFIMDLDVTSPLRAIEDLNAAFDILKGYPEAFDIFSVNQANRNPYFNMVELNKGSSYVKLVKEGQFLTRQSAPKVYDLNASFYIYRRNFFKLDFKTPITEKSLIYEVPHMCFDLDHPIDYEFMSFLIKKDRLDFKLLK